LESGHLQHDKREVAQQSRLQPKEVDNLFLGIFQEYTNLHSNGQAPRNNAT
jgi:hypothetical protein